MAVITVQQGKEQTGQCILCEDGANLLDVLIKNNVFVDHPCNGTGVCGKCRVRILGHEPEICKSCMITVSGDMTIELLQTGEKERKHRVLTSGYVPEFERDMFDSGYGVAVDIGTTTVVMALFDLVTGEEVAGASRINGQKQYGLDVLTRITYEYEHGETGIKELQESIVGCLNEMLDEVCGSKMLEFIEKNGHETKNQIYDQIADGIRSQIREIVVAANCTMTHMLLGVDARPIGRAPYTPVFQNAQICLASEIGLKAGDETRLYCLPQVSAYIGADIVAGVHVCGLEQETGNVLFIDIGTNGEIVLAHHGELISCSCAAGPALEGMNISCGMRAAEGAIEDIQISEHGVVLKTIGDAEPVGLCGSGILAAVRELIRNGFLKKTGALLKPDGLEEDDWRRQILRDEEAKKGMLPAKTDCERKGSVEITGNAGIAGEHGNVAAAKKRRILLQQAPEIIVTQDDIRQVQLAKGAILSGFTALLKKAGIHMEDLDKVLIAGQFGAHLPAESLVGVGILPKEVKDKLVYVGNSSKTGAYMALMSKTARSDMESLAEKIHYFELAESENYERVFAESMRFPI